MDNNAPPPPPNRLEPIADGLADAKNTLNVTLEPDEAGKIWCTEISTENHLYFAGRRQHLVCHWYTHFPLNLQILEAKGAILKNIEPFLPKSRSRQLVVKTSNQQRLM